MKKIIPLLAIVWLLGCAAGPPVKNPDITESNLPPQHLIQKVPIYRQPYMDCVPTSLRMVLNFYGKNISQEEVGRVRRGRGTSLEDMESYPRGLGFGLFSFFDSKKDRMKYFLAQGYPLIALGVCPPEWAEGQRARSEGHAVVVVGYDDSKKIFHVNDPNGGRRLKIPYNIFKEFHQSHPNRADYVLCIYPK